MRLRSLMVAGVFVGCLAADGAAQTPLMWAEVRARFEANNPTLRAGQIGIDEARADEITAFLRPNPQLSVGTDQISFFAPADGSGRFFNMLTTTEVDYLHERGHKRELRQGSAQGATAVATSTQADLIRTLAFSLRGAFVQLLQAKAFQALAQAELTDYDQVLSVSRDRFQAGDIAQIDLDRLELQRVHTSPTYDRRGEPATAKIRLLAMLNDQDAGRSVRRDGTCDFTVLAQSLDAPASLRCRPGPISRRRCRRSTKRRRPSARDCQRSTDPRLSPTSAG